MYMYIYVYRYTIIGLLLKSTTTATVATTTTRRRRRRRRRRRTTATTTTARRRRRQGRLDDDDDDDDIGLARLFKCLYTRLRLEFQESLSTCQNIVMLAVSGCTSNYTREKRKLQKWPLCHLCNFRSLVELVVIPETANITMFWHVFKLSWNSSRGGISRDMQPQYVI